MYSDVVRILYNASRAATARGVALLRLNDALYGCHILPMPEVSARVTKRQPIGRGQSLRGGFALIPRQMRVARPGRSRT